jgi:hypothetical protein
MLSVSCGCAVYLPPAYTCCVCVALSSGVDFFLCRCMFSAGIFSCMGFRVQRLSSFMEFLGRRVAHCRGLILMLLEFPGRGAYQVGASLGPGIGRSWLHVII